MGLRRGSAVGVIALLMSLTACTVGGYPIRTEALQMPAGGFDAIRFLQFATVPDHSINVYGFTSGTTLIQDRQMDGIPLYCGPHTLNNDAMESCFVFEGNSMVIGYGSLLKEVRRDLTGKIEYIKFNPSEKR